MRRRRQPLILYWDASAILSVLIKDENSKEAQNWANRDGVHLISTLSYSEVLAVLSRIQRDKVMEAGAIRSAAEALEGGLWRRLAITPQWNITKRLSEKWPLRGADLWHLSAAKSTQEHFPEVQLLTYDRKLMIAAQGEEIAV